MKLIVLLIAQIRQEGSLAYVTRLEVEWLSTQFFVRQSDSQTILFFIQHG